MHSNSIEYVGHYGSDLTSALSAWTSTGRDLTPERLNRIGKLLVTLWSSGHETPFEKCNVHFLINSEIASHIHLLKHRIGVALNGESARYKEIKANKFFIPDDWGRRENAIRLSQPFQFGDKKWPEGTPWAKILEDVSNLTNELYHRATEDIGAVLGRKRAKESARFFKMYNSQIQCDVQFNMRSFAHFLKLRKSPHAQKEIREIAAEMQKIVENIDDEPFKISLWVISRANELWEEHQEKISKQIKEEWNELPWADSQFKL